MRLVVAAKADNNTSGSLAGICRPRRTCDAQPPSWSPYTPTTSAKKAISKPPSSRVLVSSTQCCSSLKRCCWASGWRQAPPRMWLVVFIMNADRMSGRDCDMVCSLLRSTGGLFGGEFSPDVLGGVCGDLIAVFGGTIEIFFKPFLHLG